MTTTERCRAVLNFQPFDRLPLLEWAPFWGKTVDRWKTEGLPEDVEDVNKYFGLEWYPRDWIAGHGGDMPPKENDRLGWIKNEADYEQLLPKLYPLPHSNPEVGRRMSDLTERGEIGLWFVLSGFFWFARGLLGIERHLYAFYDQPKLMHRINSDLADYLIKAIHEMCRYCRPRFMTFAEDMSYNNGPMLSKDSFDEFLKPYYERVIPHLKKYDIIPMVDSDGDVAELACWLEDAGIEGIVPLERQAGCDIAQLRKEHPTMRFIGHYDKMVMNRGEGAMRAEFERLLPVAAGGGFMISVDHQTPPGVSLEDYKLYLRLFREYAEKAGDMSRSR